MQDMLALVERIDALLPQTQCRRCGYEGCRPYAEAIAAGEAGIDRCPPGGDACVAALARVLGRKDVPPLDRSRGVAGPLKLARIDEELCIGCRLCIDACPVDAIMGAPKRMHGVLASLCSGCELCIAPCPVDCIDMIDAGREWTHADARAARARYDARSQRLAKEALRTAATSEARKRKTAIDAALARARARRQATARD